MESLHNTSLLNKTVAMPVYEFPKDDFPIDYFLSIALPMVADYFTVGVIVNGVRYTRGVGMIPLKNNDVHMPSDFHSGACMLFFSAILNGVDEEKFSSAAQIDLLDQIGEIVEDSYSIGWAMIRTSNLKKFDDYCSPIESTFGIGLRVEAVNRPEIQGTPSAIALHKLGTNLVPDCLLIAEDTSFGWEAMNGAPGQYIADFWKYSNTSDVSRIVLGLGRNKCLLYSCIAATYSSNNELNVVISPIQCTGIWIPDDQYILSSYSHHFLPDGENTISRLRDISVRWLRYRLKINSMHFSLPRKKKRKL